MGQYNSPEDLLDVIAALEKRVRALETVANLHAASIDAGDLTIQAGGSVVVKGSNGNTLLRAGRFDGGANLADGTKQSALHAYREDGSIAFELFDPDPPLDGFHQYFAIKDRNDSIILADDTTSGQGLARPYMQQAWVSSDISNFANTSSTSFQVAYECLMYKQHPNLWLTIAKYSSDGVTDGEYRIRDWYTGDIVYGPVLLDGTYSISFDQPVIDMTAYEHMRAMWLLLEFRRKTGAGSVNVRLVATHGVQSL